MKKKRKMVSVSKELINNKTIYSTDYKESKQYIIIKGSHVEELYQVDRVYLSEE